MSWLPDNPPAQGDTHACKALAQVIVPRARDIGGFEVRRALPSAQRQMVGPFIFFDQMGPAELLVGGGIDVRPHPHIGLATVTYLFEGEIFHRDTLGNALAIRPGAVNLMTAGRGIAHSERETGEARTHTRRVFGIQAWAALPRSHEESEPGFFHHAEAELPRIEADGTSVRIILGEAYGKRSPAAFPHPSLYAEALLSPGAALPVDADYDERAIYIASGSIDVAGDRFEAGRLLVFRPGDRLTVKALTDARLMLVAGEPMDGPRHIWWNFVSSSKDRIEAAKSDWSNGRFGLIAGDDKESIPLPT